MTAPVEARVKRAVTASGVDEGYELHVKRGSHTTVTGELTVTDLHELLVAVATALRSIQNPWSIRDPSGSL